MIVRVHVDMSEDRMSQQTIRQQARGTTREMAEKRRRGREELAEQVMVAIGQPDAAVAEAEKRAGEALRELTEVAGLSLGETVEWCGETLTVREATRLRRLATLDQDDTVPCRQRQRQRRVGERVPVRRLAQAVGVFVGTAATASAAHRSRSRPVAAESRMIGHLSALVPGHRPPQLLIQGQHLATSSSWAASVLWPSDRWTASLNPSSARLESRLRCRRPSIHDQLTFLVPPDDSILDLS